MTSTNPNRVRRVLLHFRHFLVHIYIYIYVYIYIFSYRVPGNPYAISGFDEILFWKNGNKKRGIRLLTSEKKKTITGDIGFVCASVFKSQPSI